MSIKVRLAQAGAVGAVAVAGALAFLFEGEEQPYTDMVGVRTVCIGHTGPGIMNRLYTEQECTDLFIQDLNHAHSTVQRCTPGLPEPIQAAFTSLTFNIGSGAYCKSTLARKANAGDLAGACEQLKRWVYAGGKQVPGLIRRRAAEYQLCQEGL